MAKQQKKEKQSKTEVRATKSFLINVLYHVGFNQHGIKYISGASSSDIKNSVVK